MKRKLYIPLVILILGLLAYASCADFTRNAYRTLAVSQATYDGTLTTLGVLYKEGKLTEAQKQEAVELGKAYKKAHNDAVSALEAYILAPKETEEQQKQAYVTAASKASVTLADLIAYLKARKEVK